jgi:tol-pal system protein YbgF
MKHANLLVLLGLLVPGAQALGASTGPLAVEDLTSPTVTTLSGNNATAIPATGGAPAQAAGADGLMVIVQQLQDYQQQLDQLRGQVEELNHALDEMKTGARDRYMDLDTRLTALAEKVQTPAAAPATAGAAPTASTADSQADQAAYVAARNKLLSGDHQGAATALAAYLKDYPKGQYVSDAHYWLGEVYRIEGDKASMQKAADQFNLLIKDFPKDTKVPAALYKLATVQAQQGQIGQAKVSLNRVLQQYPDSNEAKLAAQLLKAL